MDQHWEPSGDYGYDLVHDEAARKPARVEQPEPPRKTPPPERRTDPDQDLEYDEAHDF